MSWVALYEAQWLTDGRRRADLVDAFPSANVTDVTGQSVEQITPAPNVFTVRVEADTEAELDAIADAGYVELWREEIADAAP